MLSHMIYPWTSKASGRKAIQARFRTVAINWQFMYYDYSKIMLAQLHTKCIFHDFFVSCISNRHTDLSLLKDFSKNVSF